jgi:hypothetical protein
LSETNGQAQTKPEPRVKGRFALFDTPDGGVVIAYRPDGGEKDEHIQFPGKVLRFAKAFSEGKLSNPVDMMKAMQDS